MHIDLADLPDNVETLQRMVRTLATERANLTEAQAEIERLRLIVQKLQRSQFGRRAERLDDDHLRLNPNVRPDAARRDRGRCQIGARNLCSGPNNSQYVSVRGGLESDE